MIVEDIKVYDGNIIHNRFAYTYFRNNTLPIGNIVAFRAPMLVEADGMIDLEDTLKNDYIYSDDAINFIWEIPGLTAFGAVAWQRLFNTNVANILSSQYLKAPIEVDGDDLIVHKEFEQHGIIQPKGKCSVSITYEKNGAALGHTAINVTAGRKAPAFAYSTDLSDVDCLNFMKNVVDMFYAMNDDMFIATTKIIIK
tara:strand:+ start:6236 stop:6826 length:591 start_codon:yes stop_codon:yes gene_type:complete